MCLYRKPTVALKPNENLVLMHYVQDIDRDPQFDHEVAQVPENRARNRFGNIFPCTYKEKQLLECSYAWLVSWSYKALYEILHFMYIPLNMCQMTLTEWF